MHSNHAKKIHYDSSPNMTPLVDVVMVILIFLMLCGSFGGMEHYLATNLPIRTPGPESKIMPVDQTLSLDIRIDQDPLNPARWKARFGDVVTNSPVALEQALHHKRLLYETTGRGADSLQVLINPSRLVQWKSLISVHEAAVKAGYTKIAFSSAH